MGPYSSYHMAIVSPDEIAELGSIPSTETVGDSCDNSMAAASDALCATGPIRTLTVSIGRNSFLIEL